MQTQPPPRGDEAREALAAVLHDQKARAERREQASPRPRNRGAVQALIAVVLAALTLWAWVSPPSVVQPPPPPPLSPALVEAELRLTVYQAVLAVEAHQERTGSLPDHILDVFDGPAEAEGLEYARLDEGRFRLTGVRGEHVVAYTTGEATSALLGDARRMLETGR